MTEELVSAVKRAMYAVEVSVGGFGVKPVDDAQLTDAEVEAIARAIIPIVQAAERERCAQVADKRAAVRLKSWQAGATSVDWEAMREAEIVAAAIRTGGQP